MLRLIVLLLMAIILLPFYCYSQDNRPYRPLNAEIFGAWSLICPAKTEDISKCQISQAVASDPKGQNILLGVSVHFAGMPKMPVIDFRLTSKTVQGV